LLSRQIFLHNRVYFRAVFVLFISVTTHAEKTVLVLKDEPSVMKLRKQAVSRYNSIEATAAEKAIRLFADRGHHADLFFNDDVTLPRRSLRGSQSARDSDLWVPRE
jgi:hypothetical protein